MKTYFLLSSAPGEDLPAVKRFHADVEAELRILAGTGVGGLLNNGWARPGGGISEEVGQNVAPALVALCSDRYFADDGCRRSWADFAAVPENGAGRRHGGEDGFIPVLWRPPDQRFPRDAERLIARVGGALGGGVHALLRDGRLDEYYGVVREVATRVTAAQPRRDADRAVVPGADPRLAQDRSRLPRDRSNPPRDRSGSPPGPSEPRPPNGATARVGRIVVTFVGSDQEWADWISGAARAAGRMVTCVRWRSTHGQRLDTLAAEIQRHDPDLVVALFSRRFRPAEPTAAATALPQEWEVFGDAGRFAGRIVRVVLDNEPLPEPLRAAAAHDVSELDESAVAAMFAALGLPPSVAAIPAAAIPAAAIPATAIPATRPAAARPVPIRPAVRPAPARPVALRAPGTAPQIWNTPAENEFFAGRDGELARLHDVLAGVGSAVLTARDGLAHLGATEVAIEYAHRYKIAYGLVWWVSCPDGIAGQLTQLRELLRSAGVGPRRADDPPRLIVFADADDPTELATYLPGPGSPGGPLADLDTRVLVVAARTCAEWADQTVTVGPLGRAESIQLLREAAAVDPTAAAQIAALLDDRPALLAGAARHLLRGDVSPGTCIELLQAGRAAANDVTSRSQPARRQPARRPPARRPSDPVGVTDREVNSLLGELMLVNSVNEPDRFRAWRATLEHVLGRGVPMVDSQPLGARLLSVLDDAVRQPGPGMLDAVARALETLDPTDRQTRRFRALVDEIGARWEAPPDAVVPGLRPAGLPGPAAAGDGTPGLLFFTSYARQRDNRYVRQFHRALQGELALRLPRGEPAEGFLDLLSLQGGAHWRYELRQAVTTTPVMLMLRSDDYFRSDWCGREFAVFAERIRRSAGSTHPPTPAILPVDWLPLTISEPSMVQELQLTRPELGAGLDELALLDLMRFHKAAFRRYIKALAERIGAVSRNPLPPLDLARADVLAPGFGVGP